MKKELGTANSGSRDKRNGFRKDNYGSFFGPSQPVIAQRVIQESKSLLENPNLAARISKANHANNKSSGSTPMKSKAQGNYAPKPTNRLKANVEIRKNTRDYSFLLSEDAEVPAPTRSPPPRNVSAPKSGVLLLLYAVWNKQVVNVRGRVVNGHDRGREANGHDRGREVVNGHDRRREANGYDRGREANGHDRGREVNGHDRGREVSGHDRRREVNGRDVRKQIPSSSQSRPKSGMEKVGPASKLSVESRKQLGSNNGSGPGRPLASKGSVPSKSPVSATGKVAPAITKNTMAKPHTSQMQSGVRKPAPTHLQSGVQRQTSLHGKSPVLRRDYQESSKPKVMTKQALSSSRDQLKRPPPKPAGRGALAEERPKAKPKRAHQDEESDGDNAISMIRQMFRYNPNKFRDDDDDSDMEAGFDDIMREEKLSAKIAREEDEEQLRLIEEEERRERMRLAKKRKMGH
ncbi:hypothetical protein BUALT_Bualt11G0063500 [Buddleja alternifolia]|uniref:Protein SPT2 homolog n=1 Tax=Buddleja alternifolia TaxID=168488 RepID=A0AAV6X032_9LAMI|nr:hypothetical protein BUALT_Bualt11G0063500 [Buddleja alternifolia]